MLRAEKGTEAWPGAQTVLSLFYSTPPPLKSNTPKAAGDKVQEELGRRVLVLAAPLAAYDRQMN